MLNSSAFSIPSEECTLSTCGLEQAQLDYIPSLGGNAAFLAIFSVLLVVHTVQGFRYRTWGVLVGMFAGLILEVIGYAARIKMHSNPFQTGPSTTQFVCLTIGPAFLSAAIYLCLARIVVVYGEGYSWLKPRTYSLLFASFDLIALLLQSGGGALAVMADTKGLSDTGIYIMLGGLAFQALSLIFFMSLWARFYLRRRKSITNSSGSGAFDNPEFSGLRGEFKFKAFQIALLIAATCIMLRSFYRLVELEGGFESAAANNEPAFMVLEGPMIIIAATSLAVFHPGYGFDGRWGHANWSFRSKKNISATPSLSEDREKNNVGGKPETRMTVEGIC